MALALASHAYAGSSAPSATSQPPPPSGAPKRGQEDSRPAKHADRPKEQPKGAGDSTLVVKATPPESASAHTESDTKDVKETPKEDRTLEVAAIVVTAIATAVVAFFTVALSCSTKRLWREAKISSRIALKTARTTQGALELARNEFFASHRPGISVRNLTFVVQATIPVELQFGIHNIGDAPCTVTAIELNTWPGRSANDVIPNATSNQLTAEDQFVLDSGQWLQKSILIKDDYIAHSFRNTEPITISGRVVHVDRANPSVMRHTAFLREYDYATRRFRPVDDQEREYQD